jgi:hypothetical protein
MDCPPVACSLNQISRNRLVIICNINVWVMNQVPMCTCSLTMGSYRNNDKKLRWKLPFFGNEYNTEFVA